VGCEHYHSAQDRKSQAAQVKPMYGSPTELSANPATHCRTEDAQHDSEKEPATIPTWHGDLGQDPSEQTKD